MSEREREELFVFFLRKLEPLGGKGLVSWKNASRTPSSSKTKQIFIYALPASSV